MKFIKWILGLLAGIGGIIALFVGNKSNEKVKELFSPGQELDSELRKNKKSKCRKIIFSR